MQMIINITAYFVPSHLQDCSLKFTFLTRSSSLFSNQRHIQWTPFFLSFQVHLMCKCYRIIVLHFKLWCRSQNRDYFWSWEYLQMTSSQVNVCREWSRDGYLQPLWIFTTPTLLRLWRVTWAYSGPPFLRKKVVRRNVHEQTLEKRGMSQCTALTVEGRQASTGKGMKVSALQEGLESTVP